MSDNNRTALRIHALFGAAVLLVGLVFFAGIGSAAPDVVVDDGGDCPDADAMSIGAALKDNVTVGDVVEVCAGTYDETVTIDQRLSLVANTSGGAVVIDGSGTRAVGFAITDGTDDVTIRGFTVRNVTHGGVHTDGSNANLTVGNNTITGIASPSGYGVLLSAPSTDLQTDLNISANTFIDVAGAAISVSPGDALRDLTVDGNHVQTSGTALSIDINGSSQLDRLNVRGNTIGSGTEEGIVLVSADRAWVSSVQIVQNVITVQAQGVGVVAKGLNPITRVNVSKNKISKTAGFAVHFDQVNDSQLMSNTLQTSGGGLVLNNTQGITVNANEIEDNIQTGILVRGSVGVTASNNHLASNDWGIRLNSTSSSILLNNELVGDSLSVIGSENSSVIENSIRGTSTDALTIISTNGTTVNGNSLSSNRRDGVVLHGVTNTTVWDNTVSTSGGYGVLLAAGSSNNWVRDNVLTDNTAAGLRLDGGGGTVIGNILVNNTIRGSTGAGVELSTSARDTVLANNTAVGNRVGLLLGSDSVEQTTLRGNKMNANDEYGFLLSGADRNVFADNVALNNGQADYRSESDAVDNVVRNLRLSSADISFEAHDVAVSGTSTQLGSYPVGMGNGLLGGFVDATNTSADSYLALNMSYAQSDVMGLAESTLGVGRNDGTGWTEITPVNGVNTAENRIFANTTAFGIFAPLGEYTTELAFCREVARSGRYTMVRNITQSTIGGCFAITAGDVTLDGDGHSVSGTGGAAVSTELSTGFLDNVTVTDVRTGRFDVGVKLVGVAGGTVLNVTATGHGSAGISLDGVIRGHVVGSNASANAGDGIRVRDSRDIVLWDDVASDNGRAGVDVANATDLAVIESMLARNRVGVNLSADTATSTIAIHRNDIEANSRYGVNNWNETTGTWVDARNNWWGSADGPGTDQSEMSVTSPLADPVSGRLADGNGDNVSAMGELAPDNATTNVRFDAFLKERFGASKPTSTTNDNTDGGTTNTAGGGSGGGGSSGASGGTNAAGDGSEPELVRVIAASLSENHAPPGSSVIVTAVVRNDRESPARFTATLFVGGRAVDHRTVTVPAASDLSVRFERQFDTSGRYTLNVDDVSAGTFVVGQTTSSERQKQVKTDRPTRPAELSATASPEPVAADATGGGFAGDHFLVGLLVLLALLSGGYYLYKREGEPVGKPPEE